ncbi:MAG: VOC family protein [Sandaracinus sp.]|nr:VOC family protein [Sandaracinus sp.]
MHVHHAIDYVEITVSDLPAAKAFYSAAFGWSLVDYGPSYAGIAGEGKEAGGLALGTPHPGGPLVVLFSNDLDASLEAVEGAGGRITKPIFDFPGGRRFHFTDPSGNELAVWGAAR